MTASLRLLLLGCLLASGCAIAPRWPQAISSILTPADDASARRPSPLIDAWDDEEEDELQPYELAPLLANESDQAPVADDSVEEVEVTDSDSDESETVDETESVDDSKPATETKSLPAKSAAKHVLVLSREVLPPSPESPVTAQRPEQPIDDEYLDTIERPYAAATQFLAPPAPDAPYAAQEEVVTPPATERSQFRYGDGEDDLDRFNRRLQDVPLDVRPIEGTMPTPPAIADHPDQPRWTDAQEGDGIGLTLVSCTPWTFCFRPLYFEEINLRRYGCSAGIVQPAISGAHFFGSVALMPYKMVVWPPRSCVCSNGFSRCTDCRPPGYRECVWSWTAAAVEAGVVAGIVLALP